MEREKKYEGEKIIFSRENAAENILQGGYQICSDTMLRIMASMEKWRENYEKLCIDLSEQSYKNEKVTIKEHIKAYL
jgi:hypothetical protein